MMLKDAASIYGYLLEDKAEMLEEVRQVPASTFRVYSIRSSYSIGAKSEVARRNDMPC